MTTSGKKIKEGWLERQGTFRIWTREYFKLYSDKMLYISATAESQFHTQIDLNNAVLSNTNRLRPNRSAFRLDGPHGCYKHGLASKNRNDAEDCEQIAIESAEQPKRT